uniref:Death domain-containing protein n=1 Tax=Branchiostoma floridae TaxID=7739 RepID=C3YCJ9_BRAFL|eukprot:XP_002606026.1 hypothetical protein BRAFLDRAFT_100934 [Branchiostoma floridae]
MAATRTSAGDKARKTYETTDNLVGRRSLLTSHTRQTINSELYLSFLLPIHATSSSAARDVFQQDAPKGSLPAQHITVSFLGDARAGKTSLEKHLLDKSFDSVEEATKGLEFDVVQTDVTEINEAWQTVPERPYSRYDTGRAQYVVKEILEEAVPLTNQPLFRRPVVTTLSNFALTCVVITMLTGPVGFQLGFGVVFLLTMGIFKMFGQSYNAAIYGLIITVAHVCANFLIRDRGSLNIFSAFGNEQSTAYPYLQYVMFVLTMILIAFVVVLPSHPGGMPCLALAFCLMSSPAQLHSDDCPSTLHLALTGPICLLVAAIYCGAVASFLRCLAPTSLMLLLTAWYLTEVAVSSKETLEYVLSLIAGFVLGAMCEVLGRTMVERQRVYWASLELQGYPALLVRRSIKTLKEEKNFPLRFTLIDFAGDAVYHCTHHLFLSSLAIHLIVFNMERLEKEPEYIRRICYWVQSVIVHLKNPNPHIFIVGTHSKSLPEDRVNFLSQTVSKALLSNEKFTQFIVGKPGSPNDVVFCVENSVPIRKDAQALLLRKTIMEVASSSFQAKRQVPIKWLKVSDFVSKFKSSSIDTCLLDKRTLLEKLRQEGIIEAEDVYEAEEFEEMIRFYDEIGEIKVMDDVVVLNLKALVQLVVELVELNCDDHELGIVHVSSLRRVWKYLTAESFLSTITLFERYDILCPISQEQYLVPLLIETVTKKDKQEVEETDHGASAFWDPADSDTVLYFKFYRFYPEAIFLRLLARCLSISQKTHDLGRGADRDVYRNMGRFYQGHDFYYKVELLCQSVDQNMIRVTVKCAPGRRPHSLLSRLHKDLQQIRDRDFPYLNYTVGLPCPVCRNNHEGERDRPPPHILRIAGHDEELPLPGEKVTLMCRGKAFELDLGKQQLSILLDPPAPIFGNNWRALADELGLCFQDICYIETKYNPTEMVLEMYRKNTPTANRDQIHRALLDIDRPDAAELFQTTSVESQETTQ